MYKKTITFTDFDDEVRVEEHFFHVSKTELTKLNLNENGGLKGIADGLTQARSVNKVAELIAELIHLSYGVKTGDGRNFIKSEEVWNDFYYSNAYDALYQELINDGKAAAEFVKEILPKDMKASVAKAISEEEKKEKEKTKAVKKKAPVVEIENA